MAWRRCPCGVRWSPRSAGYVRGMSGVGAVRVSPPACPRVARTLGRSVEYLSALSLVVETSEGYKPSVTLVEWLHHSASGGWSVPAWCVCLWRAECQPAGGGMAWCGEVPVGACPRQRVRGSRGPSGMVWSTYRHSPFVRVYPRVTNPRLLLWSGFATLPPAGGVCLCGAFASGGRCVSLLVGVWRGVARCRRVRIPAVVSEGREDPRGYSGVPIGTLPSSVSIRGLQTLGYSCGVVSPLCLRRVGVPCGLRLPLVWWRVSLLVGVWRGVARCRRVRVPAGVSEGCEDPRGMCGVPIGTLLSSVSIRGLQTLGYSCGVASPLCLLRVACPL